MKDPKILSLADLLEKRIFLIPDYQRPYSWQKRQRDDLFDDIKKTYLAHRSHFMATVVGLYVRPVRARGGNLEEVAIVDGQQRITTLVLLLKSMARCDIPTDTSNGMLGEEIDRILLKPSTDQFVLPILRTNHDASHVFLNYIRDGKTPDARSLQTNSEKQTLSAIHECDDFVRSWLSSGNSLDDLENHVMNKLRFLFHLEGEQALVYEVFESLNSKGLAVSWIEKLKARLMGRMFELSDENTREGRLDEMQVIWARIYSVIGLDSSLADEVVKFAATLWDPEGRRKPVGGGTATDLLVAASRDVSGVIRTCQWLESVAKAASKVRTNRRLSGVTEVAHARLFAVATHLAYGDDTITREQMLSLLQVWEKVTFKVFGLWCRDARSAVGEYVNLARRVYHEGGADRTIEKEMQAIGDKERRGINDAAKEIEESNAYLNWSAEELRYFFCRYEEHLWRRSGSEMPEDIWERIWAKSAFDSIEHIQPQSDGKKFTHWLGNLVLLELPRNQEFSDKPPKDKAAGYQDAKEKPVSGYCESTLRQVQEVGRKISGSGDTGGKRSRRGWSKRKVSERDKELVKWALEEWGG